MKSNTATWNREDRDLLVELRTTMSTMREEIGAARVEIKEINTGITARLLNLESNAISKIEINPKLHDHDERITELETSRTEYRATIKAWIIMGGIANTVLGIALAIFFHYH